MARRNRYREMEYQLTRVLIIDAAVFVLYLLCAAFGVPVIKWLLALIAVVGSLLFAGLLFLNGEWKKKRSLWMFMGFASIAICTIVSILAKFPSPAK